VESGYALEKGYLGPYRNTRYHLNDLKGTSEDRLANHEKFNLVHSKLRNVVERTFRVLKERWQILGGIPYFPREKQVKIILACFALNNYLWEYEHGDGSTTRNPCKCNQDLLWVLTLMTTRLED
jgi:hypothetical protein